VWAMNRLIRFVIGSVEPILLNKMLMNACGFVKEDADQIVNFLLCQQK